MKQRLAYLTLSFMIFLSSCKVGPVPIDYGKDMCHYCWMTIVDKGHAAELVSQTGKAFKFDAIECMINHLGDEPDAVFELNLVNTLDGDGSLIDAETATYLRSEQIPSPMGAYLSAFDTEQEAQLVQRDHGGDIYSWTELLEAFDEIDAAMELGSFDVEQTDE